MRRSAPAPASTAMTARFVAAQAGLALEARGALDTMAVIYGLAMR